MTVDIKNVGLVYLENSSEWRSCNSILTNIIASYKLLDCTTLEIPIAKQSNEEIKKVVQQINHSKLTHLSIIDHRLIPDLILKELLEECKNLPNLIIHIYGDFFLNSYQWFNAQAILSNFKLKFVSASTAQAKLIEKLLINANDSLVIPFPISKKYEFSESKRSELKLQNSNTDEIVICYAGRISLQKNILNIISLFSFLKNHFSNLKLKIAGPFDDIGIPYLGLSRLPLSMETEFYALLESLPENVRSQINYVGNLNSDELKNFYLSSDLYVCLSTHNDEDFGMAPAEALCTGLPLFLTNWGGLRDFNLNCPEQVVLTDILINDKNIKPAENTKLKLLEFILKLKTNQFNENSITARNIYSIKAVSKKYNNLINQKFDKFNGFNQVFKTNSQLSLSRWPFKDNKENYNELYFDYYDSYLGSAKK